MCRRVCRATSALLLIGVYKRLAHTAVRGRRKHSVPRPTGGGRQLQPCSSGVRKGQWAREEGGGSIDRCLVIHYSCFSPPTPSTSGASVSRIRSPALAPYTRRTQPVTTVARSPVSRDVSSSLWNTVFVVMAVAPGPDTDDVWWPAIQRHQAQSQPQARH